MNSASQTSHQPRKRFGQNFLTDTRVIENIIAAIHPQADDTMIEIGPGQGALTAPLLGELKTLHALELDRDLVGLLKAKFGHYPGFILHQGDALKFDFSSLDNGRLVRVVGNLPYNISTPLIFHLLSFGSHIQDMYFMLQKEVVERMAATPGSKTYGRLSIAVQYECQVDYLFTVPPEAFNPAPKVESAIVKISPRPNKTLKAVNTGFFHQLISAAFQQRRKTLRNSLKSFLPKNDFQGITLDLGLRPENLSVEDFVTLSNQLYQANHD